MAGVDQNQIGGFHLIDRLVAVAGQCVAHALAVVDVHLAAIGLDKNLAGLRDGGVNQISGGVGNLTGGWGVSRGHAGF